MLGDESYRVIMMNIDGNGILRWKGWKFVGWELNFGEELDETRNYFRVKLGNLKNS